MLKNLAALGLGNLEHAIVHELLHFSVPNHGKLWKALMRAHLGDWEELEQRLNAARSGTLMGL